MNGWFKFHRKTFENPMIMKDADTLSVWVWLLGNATFEEKRALFGGTERKLKKGELVTTTKAIAKELKINESKVNRILKMLESEKQIERQTTSRNTLIYIVNWEKYQSDEKPNGKQMTNERQTNEEQGTIQQNNDNENTEIITASVEDINRSNIQAILESWNKLEHYGIKPVKRLKSATEVYKMLSARIRQYGLDDVLTAIENVKQSDFLQGKGNKGWVITFDWFVRPNNFFKVLNGNYINGDAKKMNRNDINSSRQLQLEYLLNSIEEGENDRSRD